MCIFGHVHLFSGAGVCVGALHLNVGIQFWVAILEAIYFLFPFFFFCIDYIYSLTVSHMYIAHSV